MNGAAAAAGAGNSAQWHFPSQKASSSASTINR